MELADLVIGALYESAACPNFIFEPYKRNVDGTVRAVATRRDGLGKARPITLIHWDAAAMRILGS